MPFKNSLADLIFDVVSDFSVSCSLTRFEVMQALVLTIFFSALLVLTTCLFLHIIVILRGPDFITGMASLSCLQFPDAATKLCNF